MTTAVVATRPGALALGRVAAGLALSAALVHLLLVDGSLGSVAMVLMAAACLPCAWHLWTGPTGRVWALTATADAAMLALHAQMLEPQSGHQHMAAMTHQATGLVAVGLVLVAGQLALAGVSALAGLRD